MPQNQRSHGMCYWEAPGLLSLSVIFLTCMQLWTTAQQKHANTCVSATREILELLLSREASNIAMTSFLVLSLPSVQETSQKFSSLFSLRYYHQWLLRRELNDTSYWTFLAMVHMNLVFVLQACTQILRSCSRWPWCISADDFLCVGRIGFLWFCMILCSHMIK